MTDQTTTRNQLIEQAARALVRNADVIAALVKACKCCASSGYEPGGGAPYPSECRWCDHEPDRHGEAAMANLRGPVGHALDGLLADPAALLSRLADLTEAAGKERSTEWLRTCATLPMEEWPPAPGYKGPMVPAAELEALAAENEQLRAQVAESIEINQTWVDYKHRKQAERKKLTAERDLALCLHAEAKHQLDQLDRMEEHVLTAERDALQARIDAIGPALDEIEVQRRTAQKYADHERMHALQEAIDLVRAALQGDQAAEPQHLSEIELIAAERRRVVAEERRTPESDDAYEFGQLLYAAAAYIGANVGAPQTLHPGKLWPWEFRHFKPRDPIANLVKAGQLIAAEIARLQRAAVAESATSPPDPSGRIVDHGPVTPFEEDA